MNDFNDTPPPPPGFVPVPPGFVPLSSGGGAAAIAPAEPPPLTLAQGQARSNALHTLDFANPTPPTALPAANVTPGTPLPPPMVNPATPQMADWFQQAQGYAPPMSGPELDQITGRAAQQYGQSQFVTGQQQRIGQQQQALTQAQADAAQAQSNLANAPTPGDYGQLPKYTEPVAQANARVTVAQGQLDATRAEPIPAAPNANENFTVAEQRIKAAIGAGQMGPDALDKLELARDLSANNLVQVSPAQLALLPADLKAKMTNPTLRMGDVQPGGAYDIGGHPFVSKQVYDQYIGDGGGTPLPPVDPGWLKSKGNAITAGVLDLGPKTYQAVQGTRASWARTAQAITGLPSAIRNAQGDSGAQPPPISKALGDVAQEAESGVGQSVKDFREFQQKNLPTRGDFGDQLLQGAPGMAVDVGAAAMGGPGAFAMSMAVRTASETYANAIAENPQDHGAAIGKAVGAGVYTAMVARLTPQVGESAARTMAGRIASGFASNAPQMILQNAGTETIQNIGTGRSLDWQAIMANAMGTAATFAVAHGMLGHGPSGGAETQTPRGIPESKTPVNPAGAIENGGAETDPRAPVQASPQPQEAQGERPTSSPQAAPTARPEQAQAVDQGGDVAAPATGPAPVEPAAAPGDAAAVAGGAAGRKPEIIDKSFAEPFKDAKGFLDMGEVSDAVSKRVREALANGDTVTLHQNNPGVDGDKVVPITSVNERGMMVRADGLPQGAFGIMNGGQRLEITPADPSGRTPEAPVEQRGARPPAAGDVSPEQPREQLPQPEQGQQGGAADQSSGAVGAHGESVPRQIVPRELVDDYHNGDTIPLINWLDANDPEWTALRNKLDGNRETSNDEASRAFDAHLEHVLDYGVSHERPEENHPPEHAGAEGEGLLPEPGRGDHPPQQEAAGGDAAGNLPPAKAEPAAPSPRITLEKTDGPYPLNIVKGADNTPRSVFGKDGHNLVFDKKRQGWLVTQGKLDAVRAEVEKQNRLAGESHDSEAPAPNFSDRVQSIVNRVAKQRGPGGEGVSNLGDKVSIAAAHKAYVEKHGPMGLPEFKRALMADDSKLHLVSEDLITPEKRAEMDRSATSLRAGGHAFHYIRTDPSFRGQVHGYGGEPATEAASPKPARNLVKSPDVPRGKIGEAILGKGSFIGGDVVPTAKAGAGAVLEGARQLRGLLAPQTAGEQARQMQGIAREHGAELAQRGDRAADALREARKVFAGNKQADNFDFIDKMEAGKPQSDPKLTAAAAQIRQILDGRRREVQALGKGKLEHFIQDYFPHIWEDPEAAAKTFAQILSKRPLEGSKGFLKQRTIDTFSEGIAAGLKPISDNPVDLVLLKTREMDRYILGQKMLAEMKGQGLAKYVRATDRAPEGYTKIDDKIAQVYGPPTVKVEEHVDQAQFDALDQTLKNLGIRHDRVASIGRGEGGGKALGRSFTGQNRIESRVGSDLSVIAHELGHQIDDRYDLARQLTGIIGGDTSTVSSATGGRFRVAAPKAEYDALTNLRFGNDKPSAASKAYNFKPVEQLAQVVEAYVHAPERMREVAPTLYRWFNDFVESHHELTPLRDVRPSLQMKSLEGEVPHGGLLKMGEYYAPDQAANVLNNYLSPGLRQKSGLFRGYLGAANVMNQAQLGFSAFHLGFTSMDAMTSKLSLGIEQAIEGKPVDALKSLAATPTAPFTNLLKGSKLLREWIKPGSEGADVARLVDGLKAAGGRVKQDSFYQTNMSRKMVDAFKSGNILGGLLRLPAGVADAVAKPIMEYVVPRQKLGIFADLATKEMEKLGPNASRDELRAAMGKAWDSVDNRMGQVVYDNLFWNKAVKDIGMASVRSLGWNLGTFRELGGGVLDFAKAGGKLAMLKKPEFTHRMAYALAMPALAATVGGVMHYMMTGQKPEEMKDYFFPKTGEQDENGHDVRVSLPTYMKDVYAYGHAPLQTLSHKTHPIISATVEMLQNRDFYGTKIRNEDDPAMKQALDVLKHAGKQFVPFGIQGYQKMTEEGAPLSKRALPFVGITQAPASVSRSRAEETASELMAQRMPQGSRTQVEADRSKMKSDLAKQFKTDREGALGTMRDAVRDGTLDKEDMHAIVKRSSQTGLESQVGHLDLDDALKVWGDATPQERERLRVEMMKKVVAAQRVQPSQKPELIRAIREGRDAKLAG